MLERDIFDLCLLSNDNKSMTYLSAYNLQYDHTRIPHIYIQTGNLRLNLGIDIWSIVAPLAH